MRSFIFGKLFAIYLQLNNRPLRVVFVKQLAVSLPWPPNKAYDFFKYSLQLKIMIWIMKKFKIHYCLGWTNCLRISKFLTDLKRNLSKVSPFIFISKGLSRNFYPPDSHRHLNEIFADILNFIWGVIWII